VTPEELPTVAEADRTTSSAEPPVELGGVTLTDCAPDEAVELLVAAVRSGDTLAVHLCNAYTITLAARDARYRAALNGRSVNLIDGTPVAWHVRLLTGRPAKGPVRGPSFMRRMLDEPGLRHFLYGGTDEVLASLRREIAVSHPVATVCGAVAPPFRPVREGDVAALREELRGARADVVWVGLGTPKQDYLLASLVESDCCVAVGVGAAFDFIAGHKREAPLILQQSGFEWVHRLITEPRRLWKRYLLGNTRFVWLSMRALWSDRARSPHSPN
jgi:N-acetylglucosaminyldiphosphoundecaprenol N-acetyl-beta-D-mannosaminyltransferase